MPTLGVESSPGCCHLLRVGHLSKARAVFDVELKGVRAVRDQLDASFDHAVEAIVDALRKRSKLIVAGVGKSGNIGQKIAATLNSTGSTCVVLNTVDAMHGDLGVVQDGDVVLALSYSGETEELLNLLPALRHFSVRIIAITGEPKGTLARHSDLVLRCRVPKEACPFNLAPTASTTAMLVLGDALAMAVLDARGFRKQDFARHHPAGSIGRALLVRVCDIMRKAERNPLARESTTVKEALLIMTRAKAGSVVVEDSRGRLAGVFTDGDLRRHMARDESILHRPLREVMTRKPVSIREDALAAEAVGIFNSRNIDDLVVVDKSGRPVGLVDSQDLPRLKLM